MVVGRARAILLSRYEHSALLAPFHCVIHLVQPPILLEFDRRTKDGACSRCRSMQSLRSHPDAHVSLAQTARSHALPIV